MKSHGGNDATVTQTGVRCVPVSPTIGERQGLVSVPMSAVCSFYLLK